MTTSPPFTRGVARGNDLAISGWMLGVIAIIFGGVGALALNEADACAVRWLGRRR